MNEIEKIRRKIKELQDEFISIQPKDCSLELIKSYAGYAYLDKVLSFIDYLEKSEKPIDGLEVASVELADMLLAKQKDYAISAKADYWNGAHDGVIAGAEWQAEQLLKSSPLPEDTVLFNKGVEEGKRLMMEEAVEKTVFQITRERTPVIMLTLDANEYKDGDKVHVIVIKEN